VTRLEFRCPEILPASPAEAFAFHLDPANLVRISPPWVRVDPPHITPPLRAGTRMTVRTVLWGVLPQRWEVFIAKASPPHLLVDVATRGPYRAWRHTHSFRAVPGGTEMTDLVEYELPCGWLGRRVDPMIHRPILTAMFRHRHRRTAEILGGRQPPTWWKG